MNNQDHRIVVLICANTEWAVIKELFADEICFTSPLGEWFSTSFKDTDISEDNYHRYPVIFFHAGWGKISSAAATQYVIDRWSPELIINLGTCGGFGKNIQRETIILVEKTIVYDIYELMYDNTEHIDFYSTKIDLSWLDDSSIPKAHRALMVSGDRDLNRNDLEFLMAQFGAEVGDWESGSIAFVAAKNNRKLLILRGVSDLVDETGGEAYTDSKIFEETTHRIIKKLVDQLPLWLRLNRPI